VEREPITGAGAELKRLKAFCLFSYKKGPKV